MNTTQEQPYKQGETRSEYRYIVVLGFKTEEEAERYYKKSSYTRIEGCIMATREISSTKEHADMLKDMKWLASAPIPSNEDEGEQAGEEFSRIWNKYTLEKVEPIITTLNKIIIDEIEEIKS